MDYSSFIESQLFSVKGMTCIVTGRGTGIGKGMAAALILNGTKETADELTKAGARAQFAGRCIPIEGDVATKKGVSDVYEKIANLTDRLDYLVNNAGFSTNWRKQCPNLVDINDPVGLEEQLWSIEDSDFANMTAIHCAGPDFVAVKCIPLFKNSDNPSVCNITSLAAHLFNRAVCEYSYGQSKAAEVHLNRLMAAGLLPYKIRCNSVCSGLFRSQLTTGTADSDAPLWPPMQRATEEAIPARRAGKWEEIAGAVLMLASPAGAYFNEAERRKTDGQEVVIDGGWRLCASAKDAK
ncbi:hypothetical protein I309_03568 [Cryptococcus deuterogattii LA55]|nr:hypothetical protein I309_03568 [Cryptococcus deuterogattii LA55]KIR73188.1 hypothetical protein I310_02852 [Cryptococcus deuterogattii CA1014]KIR91523.1 hypothetical protein I304_04345 [Cryptococcus deuterogattii CBS 10090]